MPSRAATAHSITVPLRRYDLHRPATKEGIDGALFSCLLAMPVIHLVSGVLPMRKAREKGPIYYLPICRPARKINLSPLSRGIVHGWKLSDRLLGEEHCF